MARKRKVTAVEKALAKLDRVSRNALAYVARHSVEAATIRTLGNVVALEDEDLSDLSNGLDEIISSEADDPKVLERLVLVREAIEELLATEAAEYADPRHEPHMHG